MRELVLGALSASDKRLLLEGGTPRRELSSSSGPLRPRVTPRRREILVSQYTPAAWGSHLAWHSYWDQHGGFGGANLGDEQLMAASPPRPRSVVAPLRLGALGLGDTADVVDDTGKGQCLTIVASADARPGEGRLSAASPVGRALLGCVAGDTVTVTTPRGERRLTVRVVSKRSLGPADA